MKVIALLFVVIAFTACGPSQKEQLRHELDRDSCYNMSRSDEEYKECLKVRGWKD